MPTLPDLAGLYSGADAYLVLNGPSARDAYPLLERRGVTTMAVNNGWTQFRPTLWCCHDPGSRFSMHGWKDPSILKFVPHTRLRDPVVDDTGLVSGLVSWMPGVVPFKVRYDFQADDFLGSDVMAGTDRRHQCPDGHRDTVSVMLCALKVLITLGFRTIYLVGADLGESEGSRYAFPENVSAHQQDSLHAVLRLWLGKLEPVLRAADIRVVNTTMSSTLTCFEFCPLQLTLESVRWLASSPKTLGRYHMVQPKPRRISRFQ